MKHTTVAASLLFLLAHAPSSLGAIIVTPQGGNVWVQARNTFGTWNGNENPSPSLSDSLNVDAPSHPLDGGKTTAAAKWNISSYGANLRVSLFGFRGYSFASSAGQVNFSITASGPLRYRGWIGGIGEVEGFGNPFPHGLSWRVPDAHEYYATSERQLITSVLWTDGPTFPGEELDNPLIASKFIVEEKPKFPDEHEPGTDLGESEIAATNLTSFPVVGTYGYEDPIYVEFPAHELPVSPTSPLFYFSENAFATLTIPSPAAGDLPYAISVQGQTHTITSGTTVDLAALGVTDVNLIRLWPVNEGDPIPQVLGLTFASEGVTEVWQGVIVPEPSTLVLAICGSAALLVARRCRQRGRKPD